jgi:hypothetical protein
MFEFHGWARIESTSARSVWRSDGLHAPDDEELYIRLEKELEKMHPLTRKCMNLHYGQCVSLTLSGLRNHRDESVFQLYKWLAVNGKRSFGVLFTRNVEDADREYDPFTHYRIFRLSQGEFKELETLFEMPENPPSPPAEGVFPGFPEQE